MTDPATSWIEQEAIERWWSKHKFELKRDVTVERVRLQEENKQLQRDIDMLANDVIKLTNERIELKKELAFARAVVEKCTPNDYANTQAELKRLKKENEELRVDLAHAYARDKAENERLKKQVKQLENMKGIQWKQ